MKLRILSISLILLACCIMPAANAQTVSGEISGSVADSGGGVVVGASVALISDLDKQTREFKTNSNGEFLFTGVVPGGYSVRVAHPGFKTYNQTGITLSGQERLSLHELKLSVGDVNTSVDVTAETAHVATDSSDHIIPINREIIEGRSRCRSQLSFGPQGAAWYRLHIDDRYPWLHNAEIECGIWRKRNPRSVADDA